MTRPGTHGDDGPRAATERALREALERTTRDVPDVPDLVERMHTRAGRLRRRRMAAAGTAGAVTVLVAVTGLAVRAPWSGDGSGSRIMNPAGRSADPATPSSPGPTSRSTSTEVPPVPTPIPSSGAATRAGTARASTRPAGPSVPAGPWGALRLDEQFTAPGLDRARWTTYSGASGSAETVWSPDDVAVRDGVLRLTVERVATGTPAVRAGGLKAAGAGERYGRWEVRWRMTAGHGVTGQFLFLGEGPGGIGHLATLAPAERGLVLEDLVHGTRRTVTLDGAAFHVLAVESTPGGVRWLLDGREVADEPGAAPTVPVSFAVQALVQGPDCGRRPLPAGCTGAGTYPQYLDVDYVRAWPYRG